MFACYFSKSRGPPRIRMQVFGTRARRFYRIVACHQRDPRDGKHMEVLGTYAPLVKEGVKEIRLRFSRVKFWLGVGAEISKNIRPILAEAGLIPSPPPLYGRRVCKEGWGEHGNLSVDQAEDEISREREAVHAAAIEEFQKIANLPNNIFVK